MHFDVKFYVDMARHHATQPCRTHGGAYPTPEVAESVAITLLPEIREQFGKEAGYAVVDDAGRVIAMGPSSRTGS